MIMMYRERDAEEDDAMRKWIMGVSEYRKIGRPKLTWRDVIQKE